MALSPATGLANYSSGISSSVLTVDSNSDRVGIGTTNPQDTLQVGTAITMGSGTITATQGNFQNVSIAGTLTYEDTTSVDSVGIITAQSGINITGGGLSVVGDTDLVGNLIGVNATGISTINNISGTTLNVTGVSTLGNTVVGGATTQLVVNGNARITGILTMGTSSITLDGTQDKIISGKYDFLGISTSHDDTAVDVFVYDTTKDSDGGEWRKKTSHTSWYNETLNTSTRGAKREFPAVAVIVAETAKVTIYDGDDPDLPMWMEFNSTANRSFLGYQSDPDVISVKALNASLVIGASGELNEINFIRDNSFRAGNTASWYTSNNISQRNVDFTSFIDTGKRIVSSGDYHIAMTVLPNALIDDTTGLPIPTIAVGTPGGASIIKDDESIVDITYTNFGIIKNIHFTTDNKIALHADSSSQTGARFYRIYEIPGSDLDAGTYNTHTHALRSYGGDGLQYGYDLRYRWNSPGGNWTPPHALYAKDGPVFGEDDRSKGGIALISEDLTSPNAGLVCGIGSDCNTGWMNGDIRLATMSSNDDTNLTFSNLATDGDFGQSSDLTSWTAYNATLTHQTDAIRVADNGDYSKAYQSFSTVIGRRYIATVNCKTLSGSDAVLALRDDNPAADSWGATIRQESTTGLKYRAFTASATTTYVELGSTGGGYAEYNNLRISEVGLFDRSYQNNSFETYGTITKTAVATGADLVGYSGFSNTNYLLQPHTTDMNFGTGTFCVMGWFRASSSPSTAHRLYRRGVYNGSWSGGIFSGFINSDSTIGFNITPNGYSTIYAITSSRTYQDGNWHHVVQLRNSSGIYQYIDGRLDGSDTSSNIQSVDLDSDTATLILGGDQNTAGTTFWSIGDMALWRVSATVPSEEHIKKIYEDEKILFQENAQATLYGSSEVVNALAYDEVTEQLHVGTPDGRSDFQGIRRINNTTTGIGTAISAHDCLIIEQ